MKKLTEQEWRWVLKRRRQSVLGLIGEPDEAEMALLRRAFKEDGARYDSEVGSMAGVHGDAIWTFATQQRDVAARLEDAVPGVVEARNR